MCFNPKKLEIRIEKNKTLLNNYIESQERFLEVLSKDNICIEFEH